MINILKNVSLFISLLQLCLVFGQEVETKKRIVIDPGHGGKDSGAIGINRIHEKDVVLNIAKEIVRLNRVAFENEFEIYLTRYQDTLISLSDRTKLARCLQADVFISLHCNHSVNPKARGVEVYVAKTETGYLEESIYLSYVLQKGFREKLGFESRGVKFGNFQVLRDGVQFFPTMLLELGFLSSPIEAKYFIEDNGLSVLLLQILSNQNKEYSPL